MDTKIIAYKLKVYKGQLSSRAESLLDNDTTAYSYFEGIVSDEQSKDSLQTRSL